MHPIRWVRRALRHTRLVPSGSPPLYRLILVGVILSAIAQIATGTLPDSISTTTPSWFDAIWTGLQAVAALITLVSLYMTSSSRHDAENLHKSLSYEWLGLVLLATLIFAGVVGIVLDTGKPPLAMSSWAWIMFGFWVCRTRLPEVTKALRELQRNDE